MKSIIFENRLQKDIKQISISLFSNTFDENTNSLIELISYEFYEIQCQTYLDIICDLISTLKIKDIRLYYILLFETIGSFNSIQMHKGIWYDRNKNNKGFKKQSKEIIISKSDRSIMSAYAEVDIDEVKKIKFDSIGALVFCKHEEIKALFEVNANYDNFINVKEYFFNKNGFYVELFDLGNEGVSLIIKVDNEQITLLKEIIISSLRNKGIYIIEK